MADAWSCGLCHAANDPNPTLTLCGHRFCDTCIRRHVSRIPKCPVCDEVVLIDDLSSESTPDVSSSTTTMVPTAPIASSPISTSAPTVSHAPEVAAFSLPPDGPPPYSSTPQGRRDLVGMDSGIDIRVGTGGAGDGVRAMQSVEYSSLLHNANNHSAEVEMRKRYKSLKKTVTFFSAVAIVLFVIILCLLVIILAMKQNPVCDLSTPHSEALTVNILGEIRYAREQAKADHRELQNRLSDIFSHYSGLLAGGLSKQITEAKENITSDFDKLDEKLNEIFRKVVVLQSHSDALKNDAISTALLSPFWMGAFLTFSLLCMQFWHY